MKESVACGGCAAPGWVERTGETITAITPGWAVGKVLRSRGPASRDAVIYLCSYQCRLRYVERNHVDLAVI